MISSLFTIIFLLGIFFTSLYPFSVREISLPILEQSVGRFGVFAIISAIILFFVHHYKNWSSIFQYPIWIIAIINAISTFTSYISYFKLNIGTAITTYYTYPIFLFLFGILFGKEAVTAPNGAFKGNSIAVTAPNGAFKGNSIAVTAPNGAFKGNSIAVTKKKVTALFMAFTGVVIVHWNDLFIEGIQWNRDYIIGLVMIIISAITSAIVLYYYNTRSLFKTTTEYIYNVYTVPFLIFLGILIYRYLTAENVDNSEKIESESRGWVEWGKLIAFNILIGYVGYFFIYRALPRLSIYWVSILSYSGIWMTILLDRLIMKVPLTTLKIVGSGLVIIANLLFEK
jgi:drug/metabolite transporter (DMT)-like permease